MPAIAAAIAGPLGRSPQPPFRLRCSVVEFFDNWRTNDALPDREPDFQRDQHGHWLAHPHAWPEEPLPSRGNRLLIQAVHHVERFQDTNVRALAIRPDDAVQDDDALKTCAHRFGGVRRGRTSQRYRRGDTVADAVRLIAGSWSRSIANARSGFVARPGGLCPRSGIACGDDCRGWRWVRHGLGLRRDRLWFLDDDWLGWLRCAHCGRRCRWKRRRFRWRATTTASRRTRVGNPDEFYWIEPSEVVGLFLSCVREEEQDRRKGRRMNGD